MFGCRFAFRHGTWVLAGLLLAGCGGGGAAFQGTISAEHRYKVEATLAPGKSVAFPADMPLNVHDKLSSQNPGTDGDARGDASADATGKASCKADGQKGGLAWGRFQIGHCLDNSLRRSTIPVCSEKELISYETPGL